MSITREDVEHIAELARLALSEEEKATFAEQLSEIVSYIDMLKKADTAGIQPTSTILPLENVLRVDEAAPGLEREAALQNSADKDQGMFRVKVVLE